MAEKEARAHPQGRSAYRRFASFATRWRDNDQYGHMNNAVYYELFDSAVNKFLIETGILDIAGADTVFLVASSGCNYFDEVAYPSDIEIGLSVSRIGSSAVTYQVGLFVNGAERTAARGTFIHVNVDTKTKRPCAIDDSIRAKFADLVVDAAIDPR
jgi:acyl-CoA thioester hydrolase